MHQVACSLDSKGARLRRVRLVVKCMHRSNNTIQTSTLDKDLRSLFKPNHQACSSIITWARQSESKWAVPLEAVNSEQKRERI